VRSFPGRRFVIHGRVQGVGFRYFVERHAQRLGLRGWVRNLPDGSVEVEASGPKEALDELEGLLWRGPQWADVRRVEVEEAPVLHYEGFHIR
jgi:acylphosphatase